MTIAVCHDSTPLDEYVIEVSPDEPPEVKDAIEVIVAQVRQGLRGRPSVATLKAFVRQAHARADKDAGRPTDRMRRAMYALANDLKLTREDRIDLAEMLLEREIDTWKDLTFDEASKVLTAMNGYTLIRQLRIDRQQARR